MDYNEKITVLFSEEDLDERTQSWESAKQRNKHHPLTPERQQSHDETGVPLLLLIAKTG